MITYYIILPYYIFNTEYDYWNYKIYLIPLLLFFIFIQTIMNNYIVRVLDSRYIQIYF